MARIAAGWVWLRWRCVPDRQNQGIGSAMIMAGLTALKEKGRQGCVLVGDPEYYRRFGFKRHDGLVMEGVPPEYFLALPFVGIVPSGIVAHHPAFAVCW